VQSIYLLQRLAHDRQKQFLQEAEQYRRAKQAVAGREPRRASRFSLAPVVEWLECRLGSLRWRLVRRLRTAMPSAASPGTLAYREPC
jgi:hypothetical protein